MPTVFIKTELTKKDQPKDFIFFGYTECFPSSPQEILYEDNKFYQLDAQGKRVYYNVTHWLKEVELNLIGLYEIFDIDTNILHRFYSDTELVKFANDEQEKYDAHNFILNTPQQCKAYLMNWFENFRIIK